MKVKLQEKLLAQKLRRKGLSYSQINKIIDVSQGSLSSWLKTIRLSEEQQLQMRKRIIQGQLKGAQIRRKQKENQIICLKNEARDEIRFLTDSEIFLLGIILYWCEGSKQTNRCKTEGIKFTNSDPRMIRLFLYWLGKSLHVKINPVNIKIFLYLHKGSPERKIKNFWIKYLDISENYFGKTVIKNILFDKERKKEYNGVARLVLRKSTKLNRKISAWVDAIYNQILRDSVVVARPPLKRKS